MTKEIVAKGFDYDFQNDSMFFYTKGKKYMYSIESNGIILDFDESGNLKGLEILDASKKFHVSKSDLSNIRHFHADMEISEENIKVNMKIAILKRNTLLDKFSEALAINSMKLPSGTQKIAVTF